MTKLLIDECLSEILAHIARERGYHDASHIRWIGKAGWKDWALKKLLLDEDWVLVTRNSVDFRGPSEAPGSSGQYANVPLHPGLICINSSGALKRELQAVLFHKALDNLEVDGNLINQVLEIDCEGDENSVVVRRYNLPAE